MSDNTENETFLSGPKVRKRYGIGEATLWRWERNPDLNFPAPLRIGKKKLFSVRALEEWERRQAVKSVRT